MSITRLLCASLLWVLSVTPSVSAQSGSGQNAVKAPLNLNLITESDRVRVTTPGAALVWRLEVLNAQGATIFDSGVVTGPELDWPLIDAQGQPIDSGRYRYTLTIHDGTSPPRVQRGELQIERVRSLYQVSPLTSESTGGITLTTTEGAAPSATGSDLTSPSSLPRSLGSATFGAPQPYISGSGTTGTMTKWIDGAAGTVGDTNVTESNGNVLIGNGTYHGNLHIFGGATSDVFAGMGVNLSTGPAFNFGYAGASFGRGAGFFNVRPDASASPPNPSLRFMTANLERMIITNEGKIGIGRSDPFAKLDVVASGYAISGQSTNNQAGAYGVSSSGQGVFGQSSTGNGVYGGSSGGVGVWGVSSLDTGVRGSSPGGGYGVYGDSPGIGVYGFGAVDTGVYGQSDSGNGVFGTSPYGRGIYGYSFSGIGIRGQSPNGTAAKFDGKVSVIGSVGIGIETPARALDVEGLFRVKNGAFGIEMNGAGELFPVLDAVQSLGDGTHRWQAVFATLGTIQTSDARLKQRVTNLENGLAAVTRLRPVSFEWKETGDGRRHLGLLAQEVEPVIPEVIHRDASPDAPLGLNYSELIPVVIRAIQEQQTSITRLADENARLTSRIAALEEIVSQIKKQPK